VTTPRFPGHPDPLQVGDKIMLIDRKGRRYLQTLTPGSAFHFHGGMIAHELMIGAPEGSKVRATKGQSLLVVRPTSADWTVKAPRGAQVVYPKDQAMIVGLADVVPGSSVVEAGAGSGALTSALLRAVGPDGRVVSAELREDHAEVAERNVTERFGGHPANWELVLGDVADVLPGRTCDRVILDLLEPAAVLDAAADALHPGGILLAYTPTVLPMQRLRGAIAEHDGFGLEQTVETLVRGWHVDGLAVRPDHRMVAHTAFLTTTRRLADPVQEAPAALEAAAAGSGIEPLPPIDSRVASSEEAPP
jgi:tRNA (adenine57-N1/adenine58-N1)-methyltransferase